MHAYIYIDRKVLVWGQTERFPDTRIGTTKFEVMETFVRIHTYIHSLIHTHVCMKFSRQNFAV
jgi:hypothetical protein